MHLLLEFSVYNISEKSNKQNTSSSFIFIGLTKHDVLEKKLNENSSNFASVPSYLGKSNSHFGESQIEINSSIYNENEGRITANYEVNIDRKNTSNINDNVGTNNYINESRIENYSSKNNDFQSINTDNSQLAQSNNQLEALNASKTVRDRKSTRLNSSH